MPSWLAHAPCLVAESLRSVRDPLAAWLAPGRPAAPEAVAAALARALLPPEAPDEPPTWLRPDQRLSFRRSLAAVRRFGGALLADEVGTGKTYIALAVAQALTPRSPIHVLAPASLLPQWREAARRTGLVVRVHSHETLSRGRPPGAGQGAVIVDESHRFRTGATRRYQTLAPWCVGRRGLLLSATPSVNRLEDVARQLLLFVRDDALAWSGVPSLEAALRARAPDALSHLVVTGADRSSALPARIDREVCPEEPSCSPFWPIERGISALTLSEDRIIRGLIRVVLVQALASSPAALERALGRYRSLLLQARDAAASGHLISRHSIRRLVGADADQLVLWPLVAEALARPDLAIADLAGLTELERLCRTWGEGIDRKRAALATIIGDEEPTLVFTTLTATVRHLRSGLGERRVAWCTGSAAGVNHTVLPRDMVLDWFRRPRLLADGVAPRPSLLIATDVAAEGLDLPLVKRVVHYDLPWTAVRLDQRSGRAFRLGSTNKTVEVIRFRPPPVLEAALGKEAVLEAKSVLPRMLGLGQDPDAPWRTRARVAAAWEEVGAAEGVAVVHGSGNAVVAGFRIGTGDGPVREVVLARRSSGWSDDASEIAGLLESARGANETARPEAGRLRAVVRRLSPVVRRALRTAHGAGVSPTHKPPLIQSAMRRLLALARQAAHRRQGDRLRRLEAGIRFLREGHSAGEILIAETWASLPEPALLAQLARLPPPGSASTVERVELIGVLLIEPRRV